MEENKIEGIVFKKQVFLNIEDKVITTKQSIIEIIDIANIENNGIIELVIKNSEVDLILFSDCIVKNMVIARELTFCNEISFLNCTFEKMVDFSGAEFQARVDFSISKFKGETRFIKTKFLAIQKDNEIIENNFKEAHFENKCYFSEVEFKGRVSFAVSRFKGETLFANISSINNILEFNQVEFNRVKFVNTAERINSYYFLNSTFKSIVNFENLNINDLIFYNVVFENIVTFDKVKFNNKPIFENCTFSNQFNIEHKYIQYDFQDLQYRTNNITDKYKVLLDARDLFRKLKSNRIAHHNLIDASELRAQELCTRELELKHKENKSLKEKIERWQLFFYRKLCEHHTDILQSLNSLILVIGIFGMLNLSTIIGFNCYLGYKPILEHLYFSLDFYNFHIKPFIENNHLFIVFVNFLILFLYLILVGFALCEKYIRKFFITISYVITFFIMITSPKILIPAMGIFTDKRVMLDPLSVLGGIYTIIFGFVVYSFVKTIRKNSIVPS
ncbi:pentapeptide repeat-containing protein [Campylobacter lari]|uniref:pentapeptide repeat-containing protein n=1 Tax=Campylobacter lari TaxID=201 RepID=UPI00126C7540|nr:pentapeptide repeat-containing protein [Campylobacter lari]MBT0824009.1 pentapeptide repeat-containing protein [Campylobacter lari]